MELFTDCLSADSVAKRILTLTSESAENLESNEHALTKSWPVNFTKAAIFIALKTPFNLTMNLNEPLQMFFSRQQNAGKQIPNNVWIPQNFLAFLSGNLEIKALFFYRDSHEI